jgi:streptomycin 6-kinase
MNPESMAAFAARHGEQGAAWVARLPELVATYSARWDVEMEGPLPGSGSAAWVGAGWRRADRSEVVLKLAWPHKEAETEAAGLRFFDGRGAVRLLEADEDEFALLVERCRPGDDLWGLPFEEANEVAAGALGRLWRAPDRAVDPITTLAETVADWFANDAANRSAYPPTLVAEAARVGFELAASSSELVVVHGDFNPFNLLRAEREPWLAIDPKPLLGDPAYDLAQYLANYIELADATGDPKRFYAEAIARFAHALGLDRHRIAAWAFVKSIGWSWTLHTSELFKELSDDER